MSRGPYPILLMLAMSLPSAAKALGLGDLRVDSALNEPLSAQIDIVGATRDELVELTAKVANNEIFQRFGADRPSFLQTATFKVGLDSQGRPVFNIRSAEAFTDPVINFLVDLHWSKGELIREYSLLLDPARLSPAAKLAEAAPIGKPTPIREAARLPAVAPTPMPAVIAAAAATSTASLTRGNASAPLASQHLVVARDTLRNIARRAGAATEAHAQRMMIAIFRANPHAFQDNINVLQLGALLSIPSAENVDAIDAAEAKREFRAQMTGWRLNGRPAATPRVAAETPSPQAADAVATAALKDRVQSLEKTLEEMHQQLAVKNAKIHDLKQATAESAPLVTTAATSPVPTPATAAVTAAAPIQVTSTHLEEHAEPVLATMSPSPSAAQPAIGKGAIGSIALGLSLLLGGFAHFRRRAPHAAAATGPLASSDKHVPAPPMALRESAPPMPEPTTEAKATLTSRAPERPPAAAAEAIVAREVPLRTASTDFDDTMAIDTVALERSYVDSLGDCFGVDETAHHKAVEDTAVTATLVPMSSVGAPAPADDATADTAALDTAEMNTVQMDTSELDTAEVRIDLNTVILDTRKLEPIALNGTALDYNLLDLDSTTQYVHMPSDLLDQPVVKDRRTNVVEVLKTAIERDPKRRDLRMKLLETFYSTASTNQRGFLEAVRKLAREPTFLSADDWQKVVMMGVVIAPDDILFSEHAKDNDLKNCA